MTGEREDITLYTDDATRFQEAKERVEEDLGVENLSKSKVLSIIIESSEYGAAST
jgi:hypothetical protein